MTDTEQYPRPLLTSAMLLAFLLLNAQLLPVAAWCIALVYVVLALLTREDDASPLTDLLRLAAIPLLLLLLGLPGFYSNAAADFGKDCWYFAAPIVYLAFGYLAAEKLPSIKWVVYLFSVVGVAVSAHSLWSIYQQGSLLMLAATAEDYRHLVGIGAGQSMIPAVLIVMCRKAGVDLGVLDRFRWLRYFVIGLGSLAIVLALSRTLLFVLLIGMALCAGRKLLIVAMLAGALLMLGPQWSELSQPAATQSFFGKIAHGGEEVELHSYSTMSEINDNWRGFEGYRALKTFDDLSPLQQVTGGGFGTLVDLGFSMNLGGPVEIQELPILHNGYLYLLVKTGIAGVGLFLAYVWILLRRGWRLRQEEGAEARLCGDLFLWSGLTFLLTQTVITGIYNKGALAPNLMLLGIAGATLTAVRSSEALGWASPVNGFLEDAELHALAAEGGL